MNPRKSLWIKLEEFPPIICRLLARTGVLARTVRPLTNEEIAQRSGLTIKDVEYISTLFTWDNLPLRVVRSFSEACGVYLADKDDYRTHRAYLIRNPTWRYLKQSAEWDSYYKPLIIRYVQKR